MVVARDEYRHTLALAPIADLPLHRKALGHLHIEARAEALAVLDQAIEEELGA